MPDQVIICAHRGASSTHPENTIAAFTAAAALVLLLSCGDVVYSWLRGQANVVVDAAALGAASGAYVATALYFRCRGAGASLARLRRVAAVPDQEAPGPGRPPQP